MILATALRVPPRAAFLPEGVVTLPVTEDGLDRLAAHLAAELRADVPAELAGLVMRCLAKEPDARPRFKELFKAFAAVSCK